MRYAVRTLLGLFRDGGSCFVVDAMVRVPTRTLVRAMTGAAGFLRAQSASHRAAKRSNDQQAS